MSGVLNLSKSMVLYCRIAGLIKILGVPIMQNALRRASYESHQEVGPHG
jgi:hypothetical protein